MNPMNQTLVASLVVPVGNHSGLAPLLLQLFAQRGFGVLELDNRGSANREPRFESPIYRRLGDVEVRDQLAGVAQAQQLDPTHRGLAGTGGVGAHSR